MARDSLVGTTVAGYSLLDRVGEGGTATVYRAEHPEQGTVALKVLREKLRADREMLEDLILAAHRDARDKADTTNKAEMEKLTGGLNLPPGMKLPF